MISKPAYPGEGPRSQSITDELLAYEAHKVDDDAERPGRHATAAGPEPADTDKKKTDPSVGIRDQMIARLRKELADARAEAETLRQVCQTLAAMLDIVYPEWREIRRADT